MALQTNDWYLEQHITENWAYADELFTPEETKKIIDNFNIDLSQGEVGGNVDLATIRRSKVHFIDSRNPDNAWIFQRITGAIIDLNKRFFHFDLEKIETLQFSVYDESYKGFYDKHIDIMYRSTGFRKLSFSVLLSDPEDFEGGDLLLHYGTDPDKAHRVTGGLTLFPSYALHEVTPVTKGTRYALVGWVWGPRFK